MLEYVRVVVLICEYAPQGRSKRNNYKHLQLHNKKQFMEVFTHDNR